MPRFTTEQIQRLTSSQNADVMRQIRRLQDAEYLLAQEEKELDPTAKHLLEALEDRQKVVSDRVKIAQEIKKEFG